MMLVEHDVPRWLKQLRVDPRPCLLATRDEALGYFIRRDLLGERLRPVDTLWELPDVRKLWRKQHDDGSWRYRGRTKYEYPSVNSHLFETLKIVNLLIARYGLTRRHPAVSRAAEYFFSCQTKEGDFRGILGTQYMPYYHGFILEVLATAGYRNEPEIRQAFQWLMSVCQDDGGWLVPVQIHPSREREIWDAPPTPFDRCQPSSHLATGMVLRAFAAHPQYRRSKVARDAAKLYKSRFFQADVYSARQAPLYWTKFQHPCWWPNILTGLDSLSRMGLATDDPDVRRGLDWFREHQLKDGVWTLGYEAGRAGREKRVREKETQRWVCFAVCMVLKRFYG